MKMKSIILALTLALATAHAPACSFPSLSLTQQIENVDEIFIATLLEAKVMPRDERHGWPRLEGRFQITKVLKGESLPGEITLTTGMGHGDCGVGMLVSSKYVIFKKSQDAGISDANGSHAIDDFQEKEITTNIQSIVHQQQRKVRSK